MTGVQKHQDSKALKQVSSIMNWLKSREIAMA